MFRKSKVQQKVRVLFVDEMNDLQSQVAQYFLEEMYGDRYEAYSAGPKFDCIDCELVSVMYQMGYDIRSRRAKDFREKKIPDTLDYIVFLEQSTYENMKDVMPWTVPQILCDFGRKDNFETATDDEELYECYEAFIERIRAWVQETFSDPENLKSLVI